jgi:hypothetical protein
MIFPKNGTIRFEPETMAARIASDAHVRPSTRDRSVFCPFARGFCNAFAAATIFTAIPRADEASVSTAAQLRLPSLALTCDSQRANSAAPNTEMLLEQDL